VLRDAFSQDLKVLNLEKLGEMRDLKLRETKRNEGQNYVPLHSDFSYKYNVFTSYQVDFQPTKLAKLTYVYLQLIMLNDYLTITNKYAIL